LKHLVIGILFLGINTCLHAQTAMNDSEKSSTNKYESVDVSDYVDKILKRPVTAKQDSAKRESDGPFLTPVLYPGYSLVSGFLVQLVGNVSFYSYHSDSAKISSIQVSSLYSQYYQFMNAINSDVWTKQETYNLLGDYLYYIFPTNTFGLGGKTSLPDITPVQYNQIRIYEVALRKIDENFSLGAGYNLDYHYNIQEFKSNASDITDLDRYGFGSKSVSSGITVNAQFDNRLNSNNPSNGTYANLQIRDNLQTLGSNSNWKSAIVDIRHYFKLTEEAGNVLALWSYDWLTLNGKPPYFDLPMTGGDPYNNTARGYVEGRYRGLNYLYFEAEYRFRIMNNGFLGGVVFSNVSAFSNYPNNKFNSLDPANGVGLRIKMNKKSNVNLAIDYGVGIDGSRGFVFNMSEVF
jgi:hypothetical protein